MDFLGFHVQEVRETNQENSKKIQRVLKLDTDGWRRIPDFLGPKKAHELSDGYRWMVILKHDKRLKVESMAWNRKTSFMMAQILSKCFKSGKTVQLYQPCLQRLRASRKFTPQVVNPLWIRGGWTR